MCEEAGSLGHSKILCSQGDWEEKDTEIKIKLDNFGFPEAKRRKCFKERMVRFAEYCSEVKKVQTDN